MRRAPLVPACLGSFFLGDGHRRPSIATSRRRSALPRLYPRFPLSSPRVARPEPAASDPLKAYSRNRAKETGMYKLAAIIGGFLLMAGVALAGTLTSLDKTNSPTIGSIQPVSSTQPAAGTTTRQDDRGRENEARGRANEAGEDVRGQEDEARGRANEAGEDARGREDEARGRANEAGGDPPGPGDRAAAPDDPRGPCDEAEHANDHRCAGGAATQQGDEPGDDRGHDEPGDDRSGSNRGPSSSSGSSDDSGSGHGGSDDRGGNSGHGGGDDD